MAMVRRLVIIAVLLAGCKIKIGNPPDKVVQKGDPTQPLIYSVNSRGKVTVNPESCAKLDNIGTENWAVCALIRHYEERICLKKRR